MAYPSTPQVWALVGMFVATAVVISLVLVMPLADLFKQTGLSTDMAGSITDLVAYIIPLGFVIWYGQREKRRYEPNWKFSWGSVTALSAFLLIVITVSMAILVEPIVELLPMPDAIKKLFEELFKNTWVSFVLVAVIGPVMEELFMRGIVLDGLLKKLDPKQAITISALFFGFIHLNPWQFIAAFLIGMLLGWVYWRTGSLLLCMLIHITNNTLSSVAVLIVDDPWANTRSLAGNDLLYFGIVGASALLFAGSLWLLDRYLTQQQTSSKDTSLDV